MLTRTRPLALLLLTFAMALILVGPALAQEGPIAERTAAATIDTSEEATTPVAAAALQPDVIVLMLDDLGYIPDDRVLKRLPNIKRIFLRNGKRFTRAYNEIPLCCPARANFHSGQHSLNNGIVVNTWFGFDNSKTLATAMDAAGYHTLFLGKYMNDYEGTTVPAGWDKAHIDRGHILGSPEFWKNGKLTVYKNRFFDDVTRAKAVSWLKKAPTSEPVLEIIAPYAPHRHKHRCSNGKTNGKTTCTLTPAVMKRDRGASECRAIRNFDPPSYTTSTRRDPYPTRVPKAWDDGWPLRRTCESLLVIDRLVGQLEAAQKERGRPFYFVLLSDNGMSWGQQGFPLKHVPWATRLPLYVNGPGISKAKTPARVSIIDIPVTIADMGGASMPWADGETFLPVLEGETKRHRSEILEMMPAPPPEANFRYRGWAAIRSGKWRYIRWDSGKKELYDHTRDPWETKNKARAKPGVVATLDARLDELIEDSRG